MARLMAVGVVAFCLGAGWAHSCQRAGAQSPEVAEAISSAAQAYGVPEARLRCLAWRESRFWPGAYNRAGYHGLFQFSSRTWGWASAQAGWAGASPYDPWAAAHVAAWLGTQPRQGGWGHWPPARACGL